jgi:hypothetical protein
MQFRNNKDSGSRQIGDIKSAFDATREAFLLIEVRRTIELLEDSSQQGLTYEDAKDIWLKQQKNSLKSRYAYLFGVKLPWWSCFRTPIWTLVFFIKQRQLRRDHEAGHEKYEKLDAILGRAEFSIYLSVAARNYMRQQVDSGAISRWTALSLIRSFGCKIAKDGGIAPNPVGKVGMAFGTASSLVLIAGFILFAAALGSELSKPCVRQCVVVGASQLMLMTGYFAALSLSLSWGRQRAARMLPWIAGERGHRV